MSVPNPRGTRSISLPLSTSLFLGPCPCHLWGRPFHILLCFVLSPGPLGRGLCAPVVVDKPIQMLDSSLEVQSLWKATSSSGARPRGLGAALDHRLGTQACGCGHSTEAFQLLMGSLGGKQPPPLQLEGGVKPAMAPPFWEKVPKWIPRLRTRTPPHEPHLDPADWVGAPRPCTQVVSQSPSTWEVSS